MKPFVVSVADCTFIIRFNEDHELHIFTCKSEKGRNWTEKLPLGTTPAFSVPEFSEKRLDA